MGFESSVPTLMRTLTWEGGSKSTPSPPAVEVADSHREDVTLLHGGEKWRAQISRIPLRFELPDLELPSATVLG